MDFGQIGYIFPVERLTKKDQMSAVTRKGSIDYRDHYIDTGSADAAVRKMVGALRSLYNIEIENGTLTQNPGWRVPAPRGEDKDRPPVRYRRHQRESLNS